MLKSLSTQFVATLFFGPLGLAYSSLAGAVFLSLVLAVLYFTGLGMLAAVLVWPIAIVAGLILVKLHNDQIHSSGSSLLLGPGEDGGEVVGTIGSWGRGVAVLAVIGVVGYLALTYGSGKSDLFGSDKKDSMVDATTESSSSELSSVDNGGFDSDSQNLDSQQGNLVGTVTEYEWTPVAEPDTQYDTQSGSNFTSNTLDEQQTAPVIIDSSSSSSAFESTTSTSVTTTRSTADSFSNASEDSFSAPQVTFTTSSDSTDPALPSLYVNTAVVNLREGPGTNHAIVATVERGAELSEINRAGSWIQVSVRNTGRQGWIYNRLVSNAR